MVTPSTDPWPRRIGFLSMFAFGTPLLGAELGESIGVHPRVLAYVAIVVLCAATIFLGYRRKVTCRGAHLMHTGLPLLGLAVAVALPWDANLIRLDSGLTLESYAGVKFTRLLLVSGPLVAAAIIVYPLARDRRFLSGIRICAIILGLAAGLELISYRELLASGAYSDWSMFVDEAAFSTINLSMLFMFALVALQSWAIERRDNTALLVAIVGSVLCVLAAFVLSQRTTVALQVLFSGVAVLKVIQRRRVARFVWPVAAAAALAVLAGAAPDAGEFLDGYSAQTTRFASLAAGSDNSANVRLDMWAYCARAFVGGPLGYGWGSFPEHFRLQYYPHNVIAEAAFELGILGLSAIAVFGHGTARSLWRMIRAGGGLYTLYLIASVLWVMKAGDLSSIGHWLFWLYLAAGSLLRRQR